MKANLTDHSALLALHRRWADLMIEMFRDPENEAHHETLEPERHRLEARLMKAIEAAPATDHIATKVLFDMILEWGQFQGTDTLDYVDESGRDFVSYEQLPYPDTMCPYFALLMRRLGAAAPSVEFLTVHRVVTEDRAAAGGRSATIAAGASPRM